MPSRVLREGLRSSGPVNGLSDRGFRLYVNLLLCADDFALLDWCYSWVKANALALQKWESHEVDQVMAELVGAGLVRVYEHNGRSFAAVEKWEQRRNARFPKFPMPPWGIEHILGGYVAPQAREPKPKPSAKGNGSKPVDSSAIVERIPIVGGGEWEVHQSLVLELERLYPAVDVPQTMREIRGWCIGNPSKLKTPLGVKRFLTSWVAREQDRHGR